MAVGFIVHAAEDSVGVAIDDLDAQVAVSGIFQDGRDHPEVTVADAIPLGHKVALRDVAAGEHVVKYGTAIGVATADIRTGAHVHTHNLTGERWSQ